MPSTTNVFLAAVAMLFASSNAHMMMGTPTPYGKSTLNNSPLAADGSDFPCKQRAGVYDVEGANNVMPIGVNQTLSFIGSAVHGGGSCQVSITTDLAPTAKTQWDVIYTILGGCPAAAGGNLAENPAGTGASSFQFSIPQGVSPGKYTLAWTWFNNIGNREMYMNCAPIQVTSSPSRRRRAADPKPENSLLQGFSERSTPSFPSMFLANIGAVSGGCGTVETKDVLIPDPGQYVQYAGATPGANLAAPTGCTKQADAPAGSAAGSASSVAASNLVVTPPAGQAPTPTPSPSIAATSIVPVVSTTPEATTTTAVTSIDLGNPSAAAPSATVAQTTPPAAAPSATVAETTPAAAAPSVQPTGSSPSAGGLTGACTSNGEWNCVGGDSFQQCASGVWSIVQPMAQGTTCTPGTSSELTILKRSAIRFSHEHMKRNFERSVRS